MREVLEALARGRDLSESEAAEAMGRVMAGEVSPAVMAGLLMALRAKGETVPEIVGFARAIRARALPFPRSGAGLIDTCGTGGDGAHTFNVSTAAAFIAAGAGARVAKHGNRAVSSRTGSADVLEALGVEVGMGADDCVRALDTAGVAFLFAPTYHAAMRHAAPVRRELGVRTVFNLLGPLCNPAGAEAQVVGVFDAALVAPVAEALGQLGARRAMVVHGADGLDEITVTGPTHVAEWDGERVVEYELTPGELGLETHDVASLRGGDAAENAALLRSVLAGVADDAAARARLDIALLNAAAAIRVGGLAPDLPAALDLAWVSVGTGAATTRMAALVALSDALRQGRGGAPHIERVAEPPVPASAAGWGR
ncbi:MAG TPA: anthranilate phosphoribosyltransferase [Longimicrobiales bacterium]|nr:anthranilate phosphoribosyltransferase [Longimicrobiales bacterium]